MCGRYASARSRIELLEEFAIERDRVDESLEPDYNVAPTKPVYAVMTRGGRGSADSGPQDVARELRVVRWGLVPAWAKDVHHHHHPRRGQRRPDPRPDADGDRPRAVDGLARPGQLRQGRCARPAG